MTGALVAIPNPSGHGRTAPRHHDKYVIYRQEQERI